MSESSVERPVMKKIGAIRRRAVSVSSDDLVRFGRLDGGGALPLLVEPATEGVDLAAWSESRRERVEELLAEHGGILFRGFGIDSPESFERLIGAVSGELLEYRERSTPRSQVHNNVYTSTDYPHEQSIFPHNENSYQQTFPLQLFFCCATPAESGGETPIVDVRRVLQHIPHAIQRRFAERKIQYVRNFSQGVGLTWQSVFQTSDRAEVEEYCRRNAIRVEWKADGGLRTRRVLPATCRHPRSGEEIWFNHATFFHVSTLAPAVREGLSAAFAEEDLPNHTYYGDGTAIEPETMDCLRQAYLAEKVVFPWRRGDVLMLDNMLTAHAREPYRGERRILTGMARPLSREQQAD